MEKKERQFKLPTEIKSSRINKLDKMVQKISTIEDNSD